MTESTPIVLRLELAGHGDAIHGRLSHPAGEAIPFSGWLGLAAAIERVAALPRLPMAEGTSADQQLRG